MEAARDIALIVLVVQGLVIGLAIFALGIVGSIAVVEATVNVRRALRRGASTAERLNDRVQDIAEDRVLPTVVGIERARAAVTAFFERVRDEEASAERPSDH